MGYLIEWVTESSAELPGLVRQVRVFKNAGGLKAFLRSRHFRKHAGPELRVQIRGKATHSQEVITTRDAILNWDPGKSRLPEPLLQSNWAKDLAALNFRAVLIQRWRAELQIATGLKLLNENQVATLVGALELMLEGSERAT